MAKLNDEIVFRPSGDSEWVIPPEITKVIPEFKGKIVCDAEAYAHVETRHGEQIRGLGYANAVAFVADTLARANMVYKAKRKAERTECVYEIIARIRAHTPDESMNRVMVYLKEFPEGNFYDVGTAHAVRVNTYKDRTPLWVHTPNAHSGLSRI